MATSTPNLAVSRYSDFRDEPVSRLLAPVSGYQDKPLVSLEESIEPVAHLFEEIASNIWVSKVNCQNPANGLTQDEAASIHLYTMQFSTDPSLYHVLNEKLRSENRNSLKPWFSYLKLFLTALHKLPSHAQTVWRGIRNVDLSSKYPTGSKFAWWSVSSCTISMEVLEAEHFLGNTGLRTLFSIECQNGKYIVPYSYFKDQEKEVVLMPGSYFEVIGQLHPAKDLHIIHVKEIPSPFPLVKPPFKKEASSSEPIKNNNDNSPTNFNQTPVKVAMPSPAPPPPVVKKVTQPPAPKTVASASPISKKVDVLKQFLIK
ncbi:unnamed protein product [Adineta ricciae]|uniref:NAD(P)(+)--arginine ADP-ribosyltransferase n=1 Tax=Adineta ricciae TaxID=249248 RepID=A0A816D492_ADIRI|nr:unnamed protein product [Adineta ricciae]